jgi:hypothetical protein
MSIACYIDIIQKMISKNTLNMRIILNKSKYIVIDALINVINNIKLVL